jgi:DNA-binding NarL/FixJ family response regulator
VLARGGSDPAGLPGAMAQLSSSFVKEYRLTSREVDVGTLIVKGLSGNEIAETLFISRKTAEAHTYNIYRKCRVKRRAAFIALLNEYSV